MDHIVTPLFIFYGSVFQGYLGRIGVICSERDIDKSTGTMIFFVPGEPKLSGSIQNQERPFILVCIGIAAAHSQVSFSLFRKPLGQLFRQCKCVIGLFDASRNSRTKSNCVIR